MRQGIANDPHRKKRIAPAALDVICGSRRPSDRELRLARESYAYALINDRVADLIRSGETAAITALSTSHDR